MLALVPQGRHQPEAREVIPAVVEKRFAKFPK
jgi:hypothetical protein